MAKATAVGRLAPSPNGALHLGHATSFLCAYWSARSQEGRLVLRLEDVDTDRTGLEYIERALEDLHWLGIDWDGEPRIQSTRHGELEKSAQLLMEEGLAYPCTCSRKDLSQAASFEEHPGAPQQGVAEARYPGTCRDKGFSSIEEAEDAEGRPAGLRLRVDAGKVDFVDETFGKQEVDVAREVGDFLILRRNKSPSYQLAVVVDDEFDQITEVVRGRDLLSSTARQELVARALGIERPTTLHLPLVCDATGRRISKRERDLSLAELRSAGISAERIVGWAAHTLGLSPELRAGRAPEFTAAFDPRRLRREDIMLPPRIEDCFN